MVNSLVSGTIRRLPTGVSVNAIKSLAERPGSSRLHDDGAEFLGKAEVFRFGRGARKFGWTAGSGPLVILVHGWAGRTSQMFTLAERLIADGLTVAGFDATAHGASRGRRISFGQFSAEIAEFGRHVAGTHGPAHAYVGHSAGGLLTMSARDRYGLRAARYVCISSPRAPYPPLTAIHKIVRPSPSVNRRLRDYYSESLGYSWTQMEAGHAFRPLGDDRLLLTYDLDDKQVFHSDAEIIARLWNACEVVKTTGLGHSKPLRDPTLISTVSRFLSPDS